MKNPTIKKLHRIKDNVKDYKIENTDTVKSVELKRQKRMFQRKNTLKLGFMDRRRLKNKPDSSYVITMLFGNGTSKTFVITTGNNTFEFKKKSYYLYYEEAYFDISQNQYHLYFFESFPCPINREIVKKNENEAYWQIYSSSLKDLIKFEYVKVLAGSHSFSNMLKVIILVSIFGALFSLINLVLASGLLKGTGG